MGKTNTWRVRREWAVAGEQTMWHHADVIAESREEALQAAEEDRVDNWRWISTQSHWKPTENYTTYTIPSEWEVEKCDLRSPQRPRRYVDSKD